MKNWKHFIFVAVLAIVALVFSFIACDDDEETPEPEKAQHSPNTPMFADKTATITTADTFTDTQWNAIVAAIAGKFVTAYDTLGPNAKKASEDVFDTGVTIIVEKNTDGYTNYKVTGLTLYVSADGVDNLNATDVLSAMINGNNVVAKANVKVPNTIFVIWGKTFIVNILYG